MRKKIAVILSGCGHRDGSEIHEAVLTLLAIEEEGAQWEALALDANQVAVINHLDGSLDKSTSARNMMLESARIARGHIKSLADANPANYSAVIIPGGLGAATNLCNFAVAGNDMTVNVVIKRFLESAVSLGVPMGAICIAPIIVAKLFGQKGVRLTLGGAHGSAFEAAVSFGAKVEPCKSSEWVVDRSMRIVTSPAYMLEASLPEVSRGIRGLVREVILLTNQS